MQGKGLAALLALLLAVGLAACGGGEEGTTATEASGDGTAPAEVRQALRQRADEVKKARSRQEDQSKSGRGDSQSGTKPTAPDGSVPPVPHQDSGGGAEQFERKGADNSIQELGREASSSERDEAAAVLHGYLDARARGHWEEACSYLASTVIAGLEQFASSYAAEKKLNGCPEILAVMSGGVPPATLREAARADVGSLRLEGDRGFVLYHGARGLDYAFPVTLEEGRWRLGTVEGSPLP